MMILPAYSFFFFFLILKEFFFLSSKFFLDLGVSLMVMIFPTVLFLILLVSFNSSKTNEVFIYKFIFSSVVVSLFLCFSSLDSFHFLILLENCVIFMFISILWFSKDWDKISSALFMFFTNIFPSILFMYFCWSWDGNLSVLIFSLVESFSTLIFIFFLGLLLSKLPLFFLHFWLTKAHVSASGSGSMILASLLLKIGGMGLYKFYSFFLVVSLRGSSLSFCISLVSSLILLLVMVRFFDLKYLVACSSIMHMAPIFPLVLQGSPDSIFSSLLMMVGHGLVSYFIFFLVSVVYEVSYHRSMDFNKSLNSMSSMLIFFFFSFFLMNLGFPPFCGLISELFFLSSFSSFSLIVSSIFFMVLLVSGFLFFFVLSKTLFSKKNLSSVYSVSSNKHMYFLFFFFLFLWIPFLAF